MLDKNLFVNGLNKLVASFPTWKIDTTDKYVLSVWYERFKNMRSEAFTHMINGYIDNEKFNPTIAGLKEWDILPPPSLTRQRLEREKEEREQNA